MKVFAPRGANFTIKELIPLCKGGKNENAFPERVHIYLNPMALRTAKTQSFGCFECNRVKCVIAYGMLDNHLCRACELSVLAWR